MISSNGAIIKRLPQNVERRDDITTFGEDNLYPQRAEQVYLRSPIAKSCVLKQADFLFGEGFELNGNLVVNRYNQTINDILKEVILDFSPFDGWALFFNVNELGNITEILPIKFKYIRYGLPDEYGRHTDVKYNLNWEKDFQKTIKPTEVIQEFPLWDIRQSILASYTSEEIEEMSGFVHYWTPQRDEYPLSSFDSVFDSAQSNGEIQVVELSSIQNGFLGTSIYKHRGEIKSNREREMMQQQLYHMTGPENAGSVVMMEVPVDFDGDLIEQLPANNNDRLFELTNETTQQRIVANYGIPFPILGIQPDGGIFNQEQLQDSYTYYNTATRGKRQMLSKEFNKILRYWHEGAVDLGNIIESQFEVRNGGNSDNIEE